MSLCKICSKRLAWESIPLCDKHQAEFNEITQRIQSGEKPPFELMKEAWSMNNFIKIANIIKRGKIFSEPLAKVEENINDLVEKENNSAKARTMSLQQRSATHDQEIDNLAKTLGVSL